MLNTHWIYLRIVNSIIVSKKILFRQRIALTKNQRNTLEGFYQRKSYPSSDQVDVLESQTGMTFREIKVICFLYQFINERN